MANTQSALVPLPVSPQTWHRPSSDTRRAVTQSAWLDMAVQAVGAHIMRPAGVDVPRVRASVGWTLGRNVRGQCHVSGVADGIPAIYIRPVSRDSGQADTILDILSHELLHAVHPLDGHGRYFGQAARAIGLAGPLTATHAGDDLRSKLSFVANVILPPIDHATISDSREDSPRGPGRPTSGPRDAGGHYAPQTGRMLKAECHGCGMVIRTTRKWLESTGLPECACGAGPFTAE